MKVFTLSVLALALVGLSASASAQDNYVFGYTGGVSQAPTLTLDLSDNTSVTLSSATNPILTNTANTGWISGSTLQNGSSNDNYIAGVINAEPYRDFFGFSLSGLSLNGRTITGATLSASDGGSFGDAGIFTLREVTTSMADLVAARGNFVNAAAFADLADGTVYSQTTLTTASTSVPRTITLDASAVANAIGPDGNRPDYFVMGGTFGEAPVPEPASMAVLGLGLAALRRRRNRK